MRDAERPSISDEMIESQLTDCIDSLDGVIDDLVTRCALTVIAAALSEHLGCALSALCEQGDAEREEIYTILGQLEAKAFETLPENAASKTSTCGHACEASCEPL